MKPEINKTRLSSGLTILTDKMPGVRSATLGFFFRVGSRHEPDKLNGISHFIEHTVFKGTSRRSALDIAIDQDRLGGNLDAFTSHEETGFVIKVVDDQIATAFDLIADMLVNPAFDEKELESEQRVIIEELKMVEDSPEEYLSEVFSEAFFPRHPLGMNIAGTPKTVKSFGAEMTRKYHRENYHAGNLVVAAAGNVEHQQIVDLASEQFSTDASAYRTPHSASRTPQMAAPILIKQNPNLEQAHLVVATPYVNSVDNRRYAADLLANIFGGGTSSRLWQKVREERGLAYNVGASAVMFQDCGFFSIFAASSPEQTAEVVEIAIDELRRLVRDGATPDELELAKQQTLASILLGLEDSAARAATLAHCELTHGRQISVEEALAEIDAVTLDDLASLANEYFRSENMAFAALGDLKGLVIDRESLRII